MQNSKDLAVVILAAGTSSRLGEITKQLLVYKDETLLKIAVKKALKISKDVFVVLGHEKEKCEKELEDFDVNIIYNPNYKKGMGSTLSLGIKHTKEFNYTMVMLCDQPFIPLSHFQALKKDIQNENIIASLYEKNKSSKVPAIFPKKYYDELLKLYADFGAKEILQKESCINIQLEKDFCMDIDTFEDIKFLETL
ncbi:nucleotidyltransferase family protein [Aliarcobacter butzleri]|uniref:nucleotidyltransferase family protein n=1 Tax=Aliarcobacter butzleri TaxID=28197 RepID=UPI00189C643E|nr:nucleotidyltransferase family protein [Aliarcobacter butzleri]